MAPILWKKISSVGPVYFEAILRMKKLKTFEIIDKLYHIEN